MLLRGPKEEAPRMPPLPHTHPLSLGGWPGPEAGGGGLPRAPEERWGRAGPGRSAEGEDVGRGGASEGGGLGVQE